MLGSVLSNRGDRGKYKSALLWLKSVICFYSMLCIDDYTHIHLYDCSRRRRNKKNKIKRYVNIWRKIPKWIYPLSSFGWGQGLQFFLFLYSFVRQLLMGRFRSSESSLVVILISIKIVCLVVEGKLHIKFLRRGCGTPTTGTEQSRGTWKPLPGLTSVRVFALPWSFPEEWRQLVRRWRWRRAWMLMVLVPLQNVNLYL